MNEIDKYLKYLEILRKENLVNNEKKRNYETLITKVREMLDVIATDIEHVKEDDFRKIFANVDGDNVSKMISEFQNIKVFSRYFNDPKFGQQPQVIVAKMRLEKIVEKLKTYMEEIQKRINEIKFMNEEPIKKQIDLVKRIKKRERLSSEELKQFYQKLMECHDKDVDINQIIMNISCYLNDDLNKQLNARKLVEKKEVKQKSQVVVSKAKENTANTVQKKKDLSKEELELVKKYQKKVSIIIELGKKYHVNSLVDLIACYQNEIDVPLKFINEVREKVGIELNLEKAKLLDRFNDILNLIDDGNVANLHDEELVRELQELLDKFNNIFREPEVVDEGQNELLEVLNNPQSLVVFLNDESDNGSMISYVEEDYEFEMRNGDRRYTSIAVRNIVKQLYGNSIFPSTDGVDKHYCGKSRIYHAASGREFRCFYIELSVSQEVKEYLMEMYGINRDNMKRFRVYLYTGFVNIENHGADYCDVQYNRCNKSLNEQQVERLNRLFSKTKLTGDDKIMIDSFIETGFDITKKLNDIEGKKRYE